MIQYIIPNMIWYTYFPQIPPDTASSTSKFALLRNIYHNKYIRIVKFLIYYLSGISIIHIVISSYEYYNKINWIQSGFALLKLLNNAAKACSKFTEYREENLI